MSAFKKLLRRGANFDRARFGDDMSLFERKPADPSPSSSHKGRLDFFHDQHKPNEAAVDDPPTNEKPSSKKRKPAEDIVHEEEAECSQEVAPRSVKTSEMRKQLNIHVQGAASLQK